VLVADFPWTALQTHTHWAHVLWVPFLSPPVRLLDSVLNVLLFVPLGVFAPRGPTARGTLIRAVGIAVPVAFAGEATQLFSHGRFPSATDLVCNLIGAGAGAALAAAAGGHNRKVGS
jgi:glycopeptide antibiotics resistance protein